MSVAPIAEAATNQSSEQPSVLDATGGRRAHVTFRTAVVAFFCVTGIAIAGCYSAFLRYDLIGTGHLPRAALWPLFLFVGAGAVRRTRRHFWIAYIAALLTYAAVLFGRAHTGRITWSGIWPALVLMALYALREWSLRKAGEERGAGSLALLLWTVAACGAAVQITASGLGFFWPPLAWAVFVAGLASDLRDQATRPSNRVVSAVLLFTWTALVAALVLKALSTEAIKHLSVLVGLSGAMFLIRTRFSLTRAEQLFVYCAILVSCAIPGQQFATYFYLGLVGPIYYATPQNHYQQIYFQHLKPWLFPIKDPNSPVVRWAFEGIPGGGAVPLVVWKAWVGPILAWTPFIVALFFVTVCFAALLRKQWVDRERLLFPLAEVPLDVTDVKGPEATAPPLFKNWLFWALFVVPVIFYNFRALHQYFPTVPDVNLYRSTQNLFSTRPWNTLNWVPMNYYFDMIGITFLLTTEMGFSFWFFYLLRRMTVLAYSAFGLQDPWRSMNVQGLGAILVLVLFYLWVMRHHLADIVRRGLGLRAGADDSGEPISYRFAFWGVVLGTGVILGWCQAIGLPAGWGAALFAIYFGGHLVLTRMVSEAGLFVFWLNGPQGTLISTFGNRLLSDRTIVASQLVGWKLQDSASSILPNALQGFKVADEGRMNQRALFAVMIAAVVVAVFACHIPSIAVLYRTTVPHLGWWPRGAARSLPWQTVNSLIHPDPYRPGDFGNMALGGMVAAVLLFMRQKFLWWPFHPLGYIGSYSTWFGERYAWSILLGWVCKVIVLKVGGAAAWRRCRPAALGLVAGNAFVLFLWLLLQLIWPVEQVLVIE